MGYPTKAVWSMGSTIAIGDGASPEVFTDIAEASKLTAPTASVGTIDVTNLDSGQYSEFIAGLTDPGSITFSVNYQPNEPTHAQLSALLASKAQTNFKITYPKVGAETAAATLVQLCVLTKFDVNLDETKQLVAAVELKCSGAPVFTAGTPS